jgi:hypothetical protein
LLRRDVPEQGGATLADDLMKEPAPSAKRLEQMAAKVRGDPLWKAAGLSSDYLQAVLDLVYSGNLPGGAGLRCQGLARRRHGPPGTH